MSLASSPLEVLVLRSASTFSGPHAMAAATRMKEATKQPRNVTRITSYFNRKYRSLSTPRPRPSGRPATDNDAKARRKA